MLTHYFIRPSTIARIRASWLAPQIERYVERLHTRGYSKGSVRCQIPLLCAFADFARAHGARDPAGARTCVEAFVASRVARRGDSLHSAKKRAGYEHAMRKPVRQLLQVALDGDFQFGGWRSAPRFPFRVQAPGFVAYLQDERGLRPTTVTTYAHWLRRFEDHLAPRDATPLHALKRPEVEAFVQAAAAGLSRSSGTNLGGTLRVFLRYCARERIVPTDLSPAVGLPQRYRLADTPRAITWDEVRRLLESVERHSATGCRDYAILLLLVTYGLRAREVAALTLDDIDWPARRLRVPGRKAGHSTAYPLADMVAEALIAYLRADRPPTADRHVFLRRIAPRTPLGSHALAGRVSHDLRQAGVNVPRGGSHTLRHTCVQRLLQAEFPLETIGQYRGHASPRSTAVYAKVSLAALREVAMGDGEEL